MQGIIDWIRRNTHWLVLLLLESISLALLVSFNGYQGSVWFSGANRVVGQVQEWQQECLAYLHLGTLNAELTSRNLQLERELELISYASSRIPYTLSYISRHRHARRSLQLHRNALNHASS